MVSGAKKTSKTQKKGKQKMVLAKDPKQLAIAAIVILLFAANTIYMVVKYVQEQNPPPQTTSQQAMSPEEMMKIKPDGQIAGAPPEGGAQGQTPVSNGTTEQPGGSTSGQPVGNPTAQPMQNAQVPPPAPSGMNPLIPIAILLLVAGLGYVLYNYTKNNIDIPTTSSKGKKKKGKEKFTLAKDPKQLAIALVVILIFAANSIYMIVKYVQEQNPPPSGQMVTQEEYMNKKLNGPQGEAMNAANNTGTQTGGEVINQAPQPMPNTPAAAPASGFNPIIPIVAILLLAVAAYLIYNATKNKGNSASEYAYADDEDNYSPQEEEGKIKLAKDPKQLVLAIIIVLLFCGNGIFMIFKYIQEQNPPPVAETNGPQTMAEKLAQRQQQNLQSLEKGGPIPNENIAQDANDIYSQTVNLQGGDPTAQNMGSKMGAVTPGNAESDVEILPRRMVRQANGKMVMIAVDNSGRSNPFLPASENYVPSASSLPFLPPPPETLQTNSEAAKVMTTVISGILYDKYSPSAIINIEGTDYLVKRGDVVNHYKVLSINKTQVLVQLGKNVYQAGVGELLSLTNLNFNTIANLNKKFGGNDVSINVKKKGY